MDKRTGHKLDCDLHEKENISPRFKQHFYGFQLFLRNAHLLLLLLLLYFYFRFFLNFFLQIFLILSLVKIKN